MATILVIDDHADNRRYLVKLLGYGGHRLVEAADGLEGLAKARAERPDLIVSDILMPSMDGFELVRQLRDEEALAATPVVFYTAAYLVSQVEALAHACGVQHILEKPSKPEVVLRTVADALGARLSPVAPPPLEQFRQERHRLVAGKLSGEAPSTGRRLEAIIDHALELSTQRDPGRLLDSFCRAAREIVGARWAVVVSTAADRAVFTSGVDADVAARLAAAPPWPDEAEEVVRQRRPRRFLVPASERRAGAFPWTVLPVSSLLYAPVLSPERVHGWVCLMDRLGAEEFSAEDERLATILAAQVGRIYESGSLYQEVQRQAADLRREVAERTRIAETQRQQGRLATMAADVGVALVSGGTVRELLQPCAEAMVRHLDAAIARIWTFNAAQQVLELQASAGLYTHLDDPQSQVPVGRFKIGLIAQERLPHLTNDVIHDPRVSDQDWAKREGLISFAGYPLLVGDRLVGVMAMFARRPLSDVTLQAMGAVANQIALGVERKRAESALQEREEDIHLLLDSTAEAICGVDLEGKCTFCNSACVRMLGYRHPGALLGKNLHALAHYKRPDGSPYPQEQCPLMQAFRRGEDAHADNETYWRADGTGFPVECWAHVIRRGAEPVGAVVTFLDVSERRRLEEQYRQAQKMEAVGRLAGGVAHDFNNLLTVINGYGQLLLASLPAVDPTRHVVQEMTAAGERATALTRQLLAFSRKQILAPHVLDLDAVVRDTEKLLRRLLGEDIALEAISDPDLGRVKADPGQIEQVLLNLAVNSRDAMPRGGKLTIEIRNVELDDAYAHTHPEARPGEHVMLSVSDTGSGMDAATQACVFEPFFTTKGDKGTGLGLATVYGIVKQSGGHIAVYSEPGWGTTFKVYLPRVQEAVVSRKSAAGLAGMPHGTETILLVEDDDAVRALTCHVLQTCGYLVLKAEDGDVALRLGEQHRGRIDLLVTDVVMPGLSGRAVAERLAPMQPAMKVLYTSGYTDDAVVRHGILQEKTAFLQKPFAPGALARKVRDVLDGQ